jgi:hypothetical protein
LFPFYINAIITQLNWEASISKNISRVFDFFCEVAFDEYGKRVPPEEIDIEEAIEMREDFFNVIEVIDSNGLEVVRFFNENPKAFEAFRYTLETLLMAANNGAEVSRVAQEISKELSQCTNTLAYCMKVSEKASSAKTPLISTWKPLPSGRRGKSHLTSFRNCL